MLRSFKALQSIQSERRVSRPFKRELIEDSMMMHQEVLQGNHEEPKGMLRSFEVIQSIQSERRVSRPMKKN